MAEILIPLLLGFLVAVSVALLIRTLRRRAAAQRPPTPEIPVSRQHRRAIERRQNKGR
ncbi:hypothetical protein [Pelagibacterium lacus]|uniref:hypothetical protein n=1 Tax=Pelagibacterium lacus TaxID=2282655 RepID=UPI001314DB4E|nr:hypothetical protein [Pelagibacterium lacus]